MANRAQRRQIMKIYRRNGMTKQQAKETVNTYYLGEAFREGQKVRLNYEGIIRNPQFNNQKDEFKQWIHDHKDSILTVSAIRSDGMEVQFAEDTNEEKFWHHTVTLFPVASAQIKLENGETTTVALNDKENVNEQINNALNNEVHVNEPIIKTI